MADAEKTPGKDAAAEETPPPKKRSWMTFGLVGGVMIVEGIAIFVCMRMFGAKPNPADALEMAPTTNPWQELREIEVARLRVPNSNESTTILYSVRIVVTVHSDDEEEFNKILKSREWTIKDAISRVIQEATSVEMNEPGKESLKRKVKSELSKIIRDDEMIRSVLIPEVMALPTGL